MKIEISSFKEMNKDVCFFVKICSISVPSVSLW